jgi:ribose transport system substrate-binding protein
MMYNLFSGRYQFLAVGMALLLFGCGRTETSSSSTGKQLVVGVTPLTLQLEYYINYINGVKKAATEDHIRLKIIDPQFDVSKQAAAIEDFIAAKVDAIICSPVDPKGIKPLLQKAQAAGIPVVIEMTKVDGVQPLVGTNQEEGGYLAGEYAGRWIQKHMNGKAEVAILDFPYFQNVIDRVKGFKRGLAATAPDAKIVAEPDGHAVMEKAMKVMEDVLQAHPNVRVVFGINDDSAVGATMAFKSAKVAPETVCVVGFDASQGARRLIQSDSGLRASVAAQCDPIGRAVIDTAQKLIAKQPVAEWVEVPNAQYLVTVENVGQTVKP